MEKSEQLDKTDLSILRTLQDNAHLTVKEIANRVHLSPTPVFERIRRLEIRGYIRRYVALLNAEKLGMGFTVFCSVKMKHISKEIAENFANTIQDIPEVRECYNISGSYDYLLKIQVADMKCYQEFVLNVLGNIPELGSLESTFVMDELKHEYSVCI